MTDGVDPVIIVAAAEEEAQHARREEEETMTPYGREDLEGDWEFKIVRSWQGAFSDPEEFARLLEEESRYGWVMLEKLDDSRVRFKRQRGGRFQTEPIEMGRDPYRTTYGLKWTQSRKLILGILAIILFALTLWLIFGQL